MSWTCRNCQYLVRKQKIGGKEMYAQDIDLCFGCGIVRNNDRSDEKKDNMDYNNQEIHFELSKLNYLEISNLYIKNKQKKPCFCVPFLNVIDLHTYI